jgi:hypothetical protein
MRSQLITGVENFITGGKTIAFMSATHRGCGFYFTKKEVIRCQAKGG